mmetsp:Transcript_1306/g.3199  ORF Transcript_1306/g.3199 Transcript_1306/m.3199 type:complete len:145 (+) Transcript_1306:142-576(+)
MLVLQNDPKTEGVRKTSSSSTMDRFDSLLLRAAQDKRKEITDRLGPSACAKVLAKGKDAKTEKDTELEQKNYESTIRNLLDSWETSPRSEGRTTKNIDELISSASEWNAKTAAEEATKQKQRQHRGVRQQQSVGPRSRRHSMEV